MSPPVRLLAASAGAIYGLKLVAYFMDRRKVLGTGLFLFFFAWPGLIPESFRTRRPAQCIDPGRFFAAWIRMGVGAGMVVLLAICAPLLSTQFLGLAGMGALLLTVHLGAGDLLPWFLRWAGYPVRLIFDRPWAAASLAEFWGRRWNLPFVEMNQRFLLRPLYRRLGRRGSRFALFALSGVLHEMALSYPAGGGWGRPLVYFLLQGTMVEVEERFSISNRIWTWCWLLTPSPWLFHEPFRRVLVIPFYRWMHLLIVGHSWNWYLSHALYAAVAGHLVVLIASVQAPVRLGWKQDIGQLRPFNQKAFWVYAFYILFCILSFAVMTWRLHEAFLAGEMAARWLAGFIALFWTARVVVDVFVYDHCEWPAGNSMVAGHALVTSLFTGLAAVYWFAALRA